MTRSFAAVLVAAALVCAIPAAASADPVTKIRDNGASANRVDLIILGDGFTSAQLASGAYAQAVESFVQGVFGQELYVEYQRYFNVWRVDTASVDSGADHPERSEFRNTAFDGTYFCQSIQRLICVNTTKVNATLSASGVAANAKDIILVLVNDSEYGGSGGSVAVASLNVNAVELILHESAHSFGLLADEYGGPPPPSCVLTEPSAANATMQTVRSQIKWTAWIDASTPLPTTGTANGVPGLFQGAQYCDTGKYRPTYNSKMRGLNRPFEQVNTEQLVRRIYNFVSPIDASSPVSSSVALIAGQTASFTITTPAPLTHELTINWLVDSVAAGGGPQFATPALAPGTHTVTAMVADPTGLVRTDLSQVLKASRSWTVTVSGFTDDPVTTSTLIKAVHVTELRTSINAIRSAKGLTAFDWTTATVSAGTTLIRAVDVMELRTALHEAYVAASQTPPTYIDATLDASTPIRAVHINQLRAAILAIH